MFDVGFSELVLLALVALIVLGPERLPRVARTLGGLTRKARSSWLNLKRSIEAEINAEEIKAPLKKLQDEVKATVKDVKSSVQDTKSSVQEVTDKAKAEAENLKKAVAGTGPVEHDRP